MYSVVSLIGSGVNGRGVSLSHGAVSASVLGILIWGSLGLGACLAGFAQVQNRKLIWLCWLKVLPLLHAPWLCSLAFGSLGIFIVFGWNHLVGDHWSLLEGLLLLYGLVWLLVLGFGSFVMIWVWSSKMGNELDGFGIAHSKGRWVSALCVWVGACALGVVGSFYAAGIIAFVEL